jgi:hypothetical protein
MENKQTRGCLGSFRKIDLCRQVGFGLQHISSQWQTGSRDKASPLSCDAMDCVPDFFTGGKKGGQVPVSLSVFRRTNTSRSSATLDTLEKCCWPIRNTSSIELQNYVCVC